MVFHFDLNNFILMLIIGLAAGFLANAIISRRNSSPVGNILLGIAGALLGGFLMPAIGLRPFGAIGSLVTATAGAILILLVARLLGSNTKRW